MQTIFFILLSFLLGCTSEETKKVDKATGELRHKLFIECMELSAKIPRQADDDISDIVEACSSQSYYMANQITK